MHLKLHFVGIGVENCVEKKKIRSWGWLRVLNTISCQFLGHQSSQLTQSALTHTGDDDEKTKRQKDKKTKREKLEQIAIERSASKS